MSYYDAVNIAERAAKDNYDDPDQRAFAELVIRGAIKDYQNLEFKEAGAQAWFFSLMSHFYNYAIGFASKKAKKVKRKEVSLKYGRLQRELAEALMWRDEDVSLAAIPSPIEEQPERDKYYEDAEYLLDWIGRRFKMLL